MIKYKAVIVGLSIAARGFLLLAICAKAYAANSGQQTVVFFQLLFVQTVVISFLSASGFFRVQNLHSQTRAAEFFAPYLILSLISLLGLFVFLNTTHHYAEHKTAITLIWMGAISTSFSSPLSGYLLGARGPDAAFLPGIFCALICILMLFLLPFKFTYITPYLLLFIYQAGTCFILVFISRKPVAKSLSLIFRSNPLAMLSRTGENLTIGIAHSLQMSLIFIFRENWARAVPADLAATVFLVFRFSDTFMQFSHMVLSRNRFVTRLFSTQHAKSICVIIAWACVTVGSLVYFKHYTTLLAPLSFAIVMQLLLDQFRQLWSLSFLYHMERFILSHYIYFVIMPSTLSLCLIIGFLGFGNPAGLYLFSLTTVSFGAVLTHLQNIKPALPSLTAFSFKK